MIRAIKGRVSYEIVTVLTKSSKTEYLNVFLTICYAFAEL